MVDAKTRLQLGHIGGRDHSFGLVIMAMIYAVGHISSAHFNPGCHALVRAQPPLPGPGHICVLGGADPWCAYRRCDPSRFARQHRPRRRHALPSGSQAWSFSGSLLSSAFFLMFVIMAVATDTRAVGEAAAIAVGGTVGLDAMFGGPISGCLDEPAPLDRPRPSSAATSTQGSGSTSSPPVIGAALGPRSLYQLIRAEPHPPPTEHLAQQPEGDSLDEGALADTDRHCWRERRRHQRRTPHP